MQDVTEETEWKEARGREEETWRLEPDGETEVPETGIVADEVEGTCVDVYGEGHRGRGKVKHHRSKSGVPGKEGEEIKSPKRKQFREEAEELSSVPSAISVLQKLIFSIINAAKKPSASGSWRQW